MDRVDSLREFIIENFLYGDRTSELAPEDSLIERGIVDSTGVLELVAFVESSYGVSVGDEEIVPENFDSIARILSYVERKQSGNPHAG